MGGTISAEDTGLDCRNLSVISTPRFPGLAAFQDSYRPVHGYVCAIMCVFGSIANMANIVVLTRRSMASSVNTILIAVAVADLLTMMLYLFQVVHFTLMSPSVGLHQPHTLSYPWIIYSLVTISLVLVLHTIACWLTVTLAIFRYLYIALPTRGARIASIKNAYFSIACVVIVFTLTATPNYLTNAARSCTLADRNNATVYYIDFPQPLAPGLVESNYWTIAIGYKIVPCLLLSVMTVLLIIELSKASQRRKMLLNSGKTASRREQRNDRREQRTTSMLLAIVIIFLVTELPQGIMSLLCSMLEYFQEHVYTPLGDVLDLLSLVNNSANFVLYTSMSKQFRDTFVQLFLSRCFGPRDHPGQQRELNLELDENIELKTIHHTNNCREEVEEN